MLRKLFLIGGLVMLALISGKADATRVSPMMVEVSPIGRDSVARVELVHTGDREFPAEVQMFRGVISENGELELIPADEDFLVFPAQVVVPARSQQVFRVQYIGEPELAASEIYYLQIRQIPVDLETGESQVQLVVNFNVLVNVVPPRATPELVVKSIRPAVRDDVNGVEVRVENQGTLYFKAGMVPWRISGTTEDGAELNLDLGPSDVSQLIGVGVVAPGRARVFFIPTDKPLVEGTISADVEL